MGRISREECQRRREEIIDVAQVLYQEMPFKEINVKEIGNRLSFTRTAIYTYFDNKEEIFLALLEREYLKWEEDLQRILEKEKLGREEFAKEIAASLEKRLTLLKILAVDMASLDAESRMEHLISFKKVYGRSLDLVKRLLEKHFPERSEISNQQFIFSFFPFLYGVYPYTEVTDKQKEAMSEAKVPYVYMSASEMIENCILNLMK
nr:TetR family transcriptional regulator [Streptococcus lutetiensis]